MKHGIALLLLLAAGCSPGGSGTKAQQPQDLESAAIARGLVRDPKDHEIAGLYARDTDRVCIVPQDGGYRVGAFVDYGEHIACSGAGALSRVGAVLHVELGRDGSCSFDARIEGDRVVFPAQVPDSCARLCTGRASFSALAASRISEAVSEARALRDPRGRRLCAN
jgi:hypothetical protein